MIDYLPSNTKVFSATKVSFWNNRDQSGLAFERQPSTNIEDSGSKIEKADSKKIPELFTSIHDQLLRVCVINGGF